MAEIRRLQPVELPDDPPDTRLTDAAASMLALGLKTLSQRAISGGKALFTLASVASCFWLWNNTPNPSTTQIVSLSIYGAFILAANVIVRKV